jgi:hypothetical protein
MKHLTKKPRWLAISLFTLSLLYLVPEMVFNAKLVNVAGGGSMNDALLHSVELFGRWISGVGVTLLVADLLLKGPLVRSTWRCIVSFALIAVIVWPSVFFGQKMLVDKFFIEPSTSQQRQEAFFASILRSSLAANALNIKGLPYDPKHASSPEEMTFLALMGGMVYSNGDFIAHVEAQKEAILERYLINRAGKDFKQHYGRYQDMRKQITGAWDTYSAGVTQYNRQLGTASSRANKSWEEVESQVVAGWRGYTKTQQVYVARAEVRAQKVAPLIFRHHEDSNRCIGRYGKRKNYNAERLKSCQDSEEKQYAKTLKEYDIPYTDMDYWLRKEVGREQGTTSWLESLSSLGTSALRAGLEMAAGKSGDRKVTWIYTNEVAFYKPKILNLWHKQFKRETGYPMGIANMQAFRQHASTAKKIIASSAKKDIKLASNWRINDINGFKRKVKEKVRTEAKLGWKKEIAKQRLSLPANLSWSKFQRHAEIQARIKAQMGEDYYVKPMLATWNNKQFYDRVVKVNIKRQQKHWLSYLAAARSQFADGGPLAEQGKSALRSIIIPPISMSLSLLLILLTVVKLPFKFWHLVDYKAEHSATATKLERYSGPALLTALMLAVVVLPLMFGASKFTSTHSTAGYFLQKFDETVSPLGSHVLKWVIHTQPRVQPLGAAFDNNMQLSTKFELYLQPSLHHLDNAQQAGTDSAMMGSLAQQKQALKNDGKLLSLPFTIRTNAANARIRVMSIEQRYKAGMPLAIGNYEVDVSAPGYVSERRWIAHKQGGNTHMFKLKRR